MEDQDLSRLSKVTLKAYDTVLGTVSKTDDATTKIFKILGDKHLKECQKVREAVIEGKKMPDGVTGSFDYNGIIIFKVDQDGQGGAGLYLSEKNCQGLKRLEEDKKTGKYIRGTHLLEFPVEAIGDKRGGQYTLSRLFPTGLCWWLMFVNAANTEEESNCKLEMRKEKGKCVATLEITRDIKPGVEFKVSPDSGATYGNFLNRSYERCFSIFLKFIQLIAIQKDGIKKTPDLDDLKEFEDLLKNVGTTMSNDRFATDEIDEFCQFEKRLTDRLIQKWSQGLQEEEEELQKPEMSFEERVKYSLESILEALYRLDITPLDTPPEDLLKGDSSSHDSLSKKWATQDLVTFSSKSHIENAGRGLFVNTGIQDRGLLMPPSILIPESGDGSVEEHFPAVYEHLPRLPSLIAISTSNGNKYDLKMIRALNECIIRCREEKRDVTDIKIPLASLGWYLANNETKANSNAVFEIAPSNYNFIPPIKCEKRSMQKANQKEFHEWQRDRLTDLSLEYPKCTIGAFRATKEIKKNTEVCWSYNNKAQVFDSEKRCSQQLKTSLSRLLRQISPDKSIDTGLKLLIHDVVEKGAFEVVSKLGRSNDLVYPLLMPLATRKVATPE